MKITAINQIIEQSELEMSEDDKLLPAFVLLKHHLRFLVSTEVETFTFPSYLILMEAHDISRPEHSDVALQQIIREWTQQEADEILDDVEVDFDDSSDTGLAAYRNPQTLLLNSSEECENDPSIPVLVIDGYLFVVDELILHWLENPKKRGLNPYTSTMPNQAASPGATPTVTSEVTWSEEGIEVIKTHPVLKFLYEKFEAYLTQRETQGATSQNLMGMMQGFFAGTSTEATGQPQEPVNVESIEPARLARMQELLRNIAPASMQAVLSGQQPPTEIEGPIHELEQLATQAEIAAVIFHNPVAVGGCVVS